VLGEAAAEGGGVHRVILVARGARVNPRRSRHGFVSGVSHKKGPLMRRRISPISFIVLCGLTSSSFANNTCPIANVNSHGGHHIPLPRIHDVFWGGYWTGNNQGRINIDATWQDLGNRTAFWARIGEYGVGNGSFFESRIENPGIVQGNNIEIDDSTITNELGNELTNGQLTNFNDGNDLYVIYLPPGVTSLYDDQNNYAGHHSDFWDPWGRHIWWAVIDWGSTDTMTALSSHEIVEAASDPDGQGYWDDTSGQEIGDLCQSSSQWFFWDGHQVEMVWSQAACSCVQFTVPRNTDPCASRPPDEQLCCRKPSLPVCRFGRE
jgi:hypothetical protein